MLPILEPTFLSFLSKSSSPALVQSRQRTSRAHTYTSAAVQAEQTAEHEIWKRARRKTSRADGRQADKQSRVEAPDGGAESREQSRQAESRQAEHTRRKGPMEAQSSKDAGAKGPDRLHGRGGRPDAGPTPRQGRPAGGHEQSPRPAEVEVRPPPSLFPSPRPHSR